MGQEGPSRETAATLPRSTWALELDGEGSYMVLPPNILSRFEEGTVEAWVNWGSFQNMSRVFDFAFKDRLVSLQNRSTNQSLWVETFLSGKRFSVQEPDVLRSNEWVHLAVVVRPAELRLYLNGTLLSQRVVEESDTFRSAEFSRSNYLGRSNARLVWVQDEDFHGLMAEVRIWSQARTQEEIRTNLLASLTGKEPGWWHSTISPTPRSAGEMPLDTARRMEPSSIPSHRPLAWGPPMP